MLTTKQKELLMFIHGRIQDTGVPPSFDEMKTALDLRSKSGIHRLITALEERGFIRRLPHRARALEVIKLPDVALDSSSKAAGFTPSVIEGSGPKRAPVQSAAPMQPETSATTIPLMGRIAAGVPISAISTPDNNIDCPPDMLGRGEHYALEVSGDSMIEAGIHDGDTVIIQRANTANNGDIIVALVEKEEATLKRMRKKDGKIELEAANPAYENRIYGPDQVEVQGKLVGLIRRY